MSSVSTLAAQKHACEIIWTGCGCTCVFAACDELLEAASLIPAWMSLIQVRRHCRQWEQIPAVQVTLKYNIRVPQKVCKTHKRKFISGLQAMFAQQWQTLFLRFSLQKPFQQYLLTQNAANTEKDGFNANGCCWNFLKSSSVCVISAAFSRHLHAYSPSTVWVWSRRFPWWLTQGQCCYLLFKLKCCR